MLSELNSLRGSDLSRGPAQYRSAEESGIAGTPRETSLTGLPGQAGLWEAEGWWLTSLSLSTPDSVSNLCELWHLRAVLTLRDLRKK